ncbi:MAG: hypothetical protein KGV44_03025 [Flavobacteriaceae bacterium]|nr:hypothetical protein [Flavobacteriaceae bacterium]
MLQENKEISRMYWSHHFWARG